jgi:glyoxylate carboligase
MAQQYSGIQVLKEFVPNLKEYTAKYGLTQVKAIERMYSQAVKMDEIEETNTCYEKEKPEPIIEIREVEVIKEVIIERGASKDNSLAEFMKYE